MVAQQIGKSKPNEILKQIFQVHIYKLLKLSQNTIWYVFNGNLGISTVENILVILLNH